MKIKDQLLTYFIEHWGMFEYTRGWLKGDCPYCGAENKFGVHIGDNRAHCFKCDTYNKPIYVVCDIEKLNIHEAKLKLGNFEGLKFKEEVVKEYERTTLSFPEYYKPLSYGKSTIAKAIQNYVTKKRNLDLKTLNHKGFGYCDDGEFFGYLIMPYFFNGKLVYYQARNVIASGPKFKNPKEEEIGVGKAQFFYNGDSLWTYPSVNLVESVINAETIGDNALASSGKSLSSRQISTIIKSPVKRVSIILDPDAYLSKAIPLALSLIQYKLVKLVRLPNNQDVNSFGRTRTLAIKRSNTYLTYAELLKIKHDAEREVMNEA